MTNMPKLLLADDERNTREALARYLRNRFEITLASDGSEAVNLLKHQDFDLVLTDLRMPGGDGMSVLAAALAKEQTPVCIVFSAYGSVENAVEAVKQGAFDFVTKPVNLDRLDLVIDRAMESSRLKQENDRLRRRLNDGFDQNMLIAQSPTMQSVLATVKTIAPTRATVLITGESGTGKEVIARAIHSLSGAPGALVAVHCAALPANLLESELFGHERGAFTGAVDRKPGRFELAADGTLFLDEIGEIEPQIQVKLLRVLENRTFERVGGVEELQCTARLLSATNRNLEEMVQDGSFREDLFYRLNVVNLKMPALRDRQEDIPILAKRFLEEFASANHKEVHSIDPDCLAMLIRYRWPGNIRELRNCMERMVVLTTGSALKVEDLPEPIRSSMSRPALVAVPETKTLNLCNNKKALLQKALEECGNNRTAAAEKLGISRRTLHRWINEFLPEE